MKTVLLVLVIAMVIAQAIIMVSDYICRRVHYSLKPVDQLAISYPLPARRISWGMVRAWSINFRNAFAVLTVVLGIAIFIAQK